MRTQRTMQLTLLASSLMLAFNSPAMPGDVDLAFDPGAASGLDGAVRAVAVQPDGQVVIGGDFTTVRGLARNSLARLNADGSGDASFNPATEAYWSIDTVAIQTNGQVLVGGLFNSVQGGGRTNITRFNADGSVDTGFDLCSGSDGVVRSIVVQPDGKVLLGGAFTQVNGVSRTNLARLNADGSLDTSFDPGMGADRWVNTIALQTDGQVLIGGGFNNVNGTNVNRMARLNADGSLDTSFHPSAGADGPVTCITVQPDGRVLIGGGFWSVNGVSRTNLARLNADGSLDSSFNPGSGANKTVQTIALQPDGRVLMGGWFTSVNGTNINRIARLNADGNLDATFNPGTGADGSVECIAVQPDGRVFIGGGFSRINGAARTYVARLNADGSLDTSFLPNTGVDDDVYSVAAQPDGKVLVGSGFISDNGASRNYVTRLNADGSLDASFDSGTGPNGFVDSVALQPDGKVLLGGEFTAVNGTNRNRIARLNADGSLDTGFNPGTGANSNVYAVAVQPDGKVLIGGTFTTVSGANRYGIARLNADGSLDTGPYTGAGGYYSVAVQSDGRALIGGDFGFSVNGTNWSGIARINVNGSLDASFNPQMNSGSCVYSVAVQPDGQVLIGGTFTNVAGAKGIARLNADGSLDSSFNPGTGANDVVESVAVQPDGKVLLGGAFTNINGSNCNYIARLNADGSLDSSFNPGTGADWSIHSVALQSDGRVLLGGGFASVNGVPRAFLARLHGDRPPLGVARAGLTNLLVHWPSSWPGFVLLETADLGSSWTSVAQSPVDDGTNFSVNVPASEPCKFYRLSKP